MILRLFLIYERQSKKTICQKQQLTELGITESVILDLIQNTSTVWLAELQHQVCGFSIADLTDR